VQRGQRPLAACLALADWAVMNGNAPGLHMLNLVVSDMPASLDFYRQLGVAVPVGDVTAGAHVQLSYHAPGVTPHGVNLGS
jgi:hypothetical protein